MEQRVSDEDVSKRDIPSFIEPGPPLINNPYMRPRPQKATNLLPMFEEDSEIEEQELVQVYLRMKPYDGPNNMYEVRSEKYLVTSLDTTTAGHGRRTQHNVSRMYPFTRIFESKRSQKEIFDQVVKENLKKLVEGQSFTLLTYGASGSGKTYTLMGSVNAPGLVPRSLEYVFKLVDAAQTPNYKPSDTGAELLGDNQRESELLWVKRLAQVSAPARDKYRRMSIQLHSDLAVSNIDLANRTKYYVWVSFVEIYNEAIYDLLVPPDKRVKLRMREDTSGQVYVKGATQAFVRSGVEAYDVMLAGKQNLMVAATGVHAHSSRSHSIFTITMLTETGGETRTSCVRLCDLAGCERARATNNTGARMQESRSINSSLHVLERCLHMLRSNQRQRLEALVPYRESKLTRLLGSGLSGSRGEAVTMVMTLNPAPQYAQETKHVLSLAVVAKDLQINNTAMFASALESSAQDTTANSIMWSSNEVQRLKTELERVHFELAQAESQNKRLQAMMEENQNTVADTMREMVEEAKDMTRQYYEFQLTTLKNEMQEMTEEYEARLVESEKKLFEEKQARSRLEVENKHLRAGLRERDGKTSKDPETEREIVVTDSEDEDNNPVNESLEPVFKIECINRSQAVTVTDYIHKPDEDVDEIDESTNTTKQDTSKNSDYETGDERDSKNNTDLSITVDGKNDRSNTFNGKNYPEHNARDCYTNLSHNGAKKAEEVDAKPFIRRTYMQDFLNDSLEPSSVVDTNANNTIISDCQQDNSPNECIKMKNEVRGTYFVRKSAINMSDGGNVDDDKETEDLQTDSPKETYFARTSAIDISIDEEIQEIISDCQQDNSPNECIEMKNEVRGTYFVRKSAINISDDGNVDDDKETEDLQTDSPKETYFARTSAIDISIDEEIQEIVENKTTASEIATEKQSDDIFPPTKGSEILVSKFLQSLKKSMNSNANDCSLRQFEQLEKASQECTDEAVRQEFFGDIKMLREKRTFFDAKGMHLHASVKPDETEMMISHNKTKDDFGETLDMEKATTSVSYKNMEVVKDIERNKTNEVESLITKPVLQKRTYFDDIEVTGTAPNKMVAEIISSVRKNHDRSPSIVVGDSEPFEPSTMKKLLGEKVAKLEVLSSINKPAKKHESIDVFESFESPQIKPKEIAPTPVKCNIENIRESIDKLVLSQKMRNKQGIKLNSIPSVDETEQQNIHNIPKITTNLDDATHEQDNTIEEFENIFKDLSTQRPTEFDLLATTQEIDAELTTLNKAEDVFAKPESDKENMLSKANESASEQLAYNLRHRNKCAPNTPNDEKVKTEKVLLENTAKCEGKKNLRSLRLRRKKNEVENVDFEEKPDLVNLKKEFSDITLGLPAMKKVVKDIPSPEKLPGEENLPLTEIQSCPSKSVLRSRRKLFTPRAEPLEESSSQAGDSNERVYVPRPSYHRARTRRKL